MSRFVLGGLIAAAALTAGVWWQLNRQPPPESDKANRADSPSPSPDRGGEAATEPSRGQPSTRPTLPGRDRMSLVAPDKPPPLPEPGTTKPPPQRPAPPTGRELADTHNNALALLRKAIERTEARLARVAAGSSEARRLRVRLERMKANLARQTAEGPQPQPHARDGKRPAPADIKR